MWTFFSFLGMVSSAYFIISGTGDWPNWAYFVCGCGNGAVFCLELHERAKRKAGGP